MTRTTFFPVENERRRKDSKWTRKNLCLKIGVYSVGAGDQSEEIEGVDIRIGDFGYDDFITKVIHQGTGERRLPGADVPCQDDISIVIQNSVLQRSQRFFRASLQAKRILGRC